MTLGTTKPAAMSRRRLIFSVVAALAMRGVCWASNDTLARATALPSSTLRGHLAWLIRWRWLLATYEYTHARTDTKRELRCGPCAPKTLAAAWPRPARGRGRRGRSRSPLDDWPAEALWEMAHAPEHVRIHKSMVALGR